MKTVIGIVLPVTALIWARQRRGAQTRQITSDCPDAIGVKSLGRARMSKGSIQALLSACFLSLSALSASGSQLTIPTPSGFARVTPSMTKVTELIALSRVADTSSLAEFIAKQSVPKALQGGVPDLSRRHSVLLIEPNVSREDFLATRDLMIARQGEVFAKAKERHTKLFGELAKGVSVATGVPMQLSGGEAIPLRVHRSTPNAFAFSIYIGMKVRSDSGKSLSEISTVTTTIIHVRGSIVSVITTGKKEDLEWTRQSSWQLAEAILADNSR